MDSSELLFAYHVKQEALKRLFDEHPDGVSPEEVGPLMDETIKKIVITTTGIAYQIREILNPNSD